MLRFIIRRLVQAIPTLFGITLLSFIIMLAAPGGPVAILSFDPAMSPEQKELLADRLGVNDPAPLQYIRWLVGDDFLWFDSDDDGVVDERGTNYGILRGDFGKSFQYRQNPLNLIAERLPATIELNIVVLLVSLTVGIIVGVLAAIWRGKFFDNTSRILAVIGNAIPTFWLSFILLLVFGAPLLDLLPMGGRCAPVRGGCPPIYGRLEYIALPAFVMILGGVAGWSRFMRAAMLDTISEDYVRTARAKGLAVRAIWFRHGLRNAIVPMATFLGPTFVSLIGGSVIIELIFSWPGVGRLLLDSLVSRDYPVVMASVVIGSVLTIIGYLISDILYAVFDPRIRL
jgi:peptide/nickel transport system permease protein